MWSWREKLWYGWHIIEWLVSFDFMESLGWTLQCYCQIWPLDLVLTFKRSYSVCIFLPYFMSSTRQEMDLFDALLESLIKVTKQAHGGNHKMRFFKAQPIKRSCECRMQVYIMCIGRKVWNVTDLATSCWNRVLHVS